MKKRIGELMPSLSFGHFIFLSALCLSGCLCAGCSDDDYEIYSTVYGTVTDYATGTPLENVHVVLSPSNLTDQTGADGAFHFENLDARQYTITVQKAGYQPNRKIIAAISGERMEADIQMMKIE